MFLIHIGTAALRDYHVTIHTTLDVMTARITSFWNVDEDHVTSFVIKEEGRALPETMPSHFGSFALTGVLTGMNRYVHVLPENYQTGTSLTTILILVHPRWGNGDCCLAQVSPCRSARRPLRP